MNLYVIFTLAAQKTGYVPFANYNNLTHVQYSDGYLEVTYAKDGHRHLIPMEFVESFQTTARTQF